MRIFLTKEELAERRYSDGKKISSLGVTKQILYSKFHIEIERKNPKLKGKYTQKEYRDGMNAFWEKVGDILVNQPNGVVLDGLGYFAFPVYSIKPRDPRTGKTTFKVNGHIPYPQFFGSIFNNFFLAGLALELSTSVKKKWYPLLEAGASYSFHYNHIKKLIGGRSKYTYTPKRVHRRPKVRKLDKG